MTRKSAFHSTLHEVGTVEDVVGDPIRVYVDDDLIRVTVFDTTLTELGLPEDSEPDGGWPDTAFAALDVDQVTELIEHLQDARRIVRRNAVT